jgi:hypothetical protein
MTQCLTDELGCSGAWATDEYDLLDLDENGWVRSLPNPEDPPEYTRVGTLMFREIQGRYPGGRYVVLYDGEGNIDYEFDASKDELVSRPGRDVLDVTPSHEGIYLLITETDPNQTGNYIRNIHVVPIEYEETFEAEIFNPIFLERIQPFQALRFMDWMLTNNSEQSEWGDRPKVDDYTYTIKGAPLEVMLVLANRLGVDPWFCMPHQATDEYITNFATLVKEKLAPNRTVYVELSNEAWNGQFQQAHYASEQGKSRWGDREDAYMQWYGMRTAQMAELWKQVFADQGDRLVTIMATQTVWLGLEDCALDCPQWVQEGHNSCYQSVDTYAIAGYFSGNMTNSKNAATIKSWISSEPDGGFGKAFLHLQEGGLLEAEGYDDSLPGVLKLFQYHAEVAQQRSLKLIAYEGGQHLVSSDDEELTEFFIELNRRLKIGELYTQLLNQWKAVGGTLFMNFSDIGQPSRWGSWGVLEYVGQKNSSKYDALMNFSKEIW